MSRGWNVMSKSSPPPTGMWTTQVKKPIHPEMIDVEPGTELMGVNFDEPDQIDRSKFKLDSPELHNLGDPLHKSLQDRIEELNEDEDDDDDDGDVVINRK